MPKASDRLAIRRQASTIQGFVPSALKNMVRSCFMIRKWDHTIEVALRAIGPMPCELKLATFKCFAMIKSILLRTILKGCVAAIIQANARPYFGHANRGI